MVVGEFTRETTLVVIGGGAGGYAAALRASELDVSTVLVDPHGVCPHVPWLATRTLADAARLVQAAQHAAGYGLALEQRALDMPQLRQWTGQVGDALSTQFERLCTERGVEVIRGLASFDGPRQLTIRDGANARLRFKRAIIAAGSVATAPPGGWPEFPAVTGPAGVLALEALPETMLVIGGDSAALETAAACAALGSRVTLVAPGERLLPEADADLVRQLERRLGRLLDRIIVCTTVTALGMVPDGVQVEMTGTAASVFGHVVVALGAAPATDGLNLAEAQVETGADGSIPIDEQLATSNRRIFAIGDVTGGPMLANRAIHQGRTAAEIVAGLDSVFEPRAVPSVVHTDPPLAWCGLTESQAVARGIPHAVHCADWTASARAVSLAQTDGLTKLIVDPQSGLVLGMGIVGVGAPEMIAHGALAVEMGAVIDDLAAIVHAHPSLSELIGEAARREGRK